MKCGLLIWGFFKKEKKSPVLLHRASHCQVPVLHCIFCWAWILYRFAVQGVIVLPGLFVILVLEFKACKLMAFKKQSWMPWFITLGWGLYIKESSGKRWEMILYWTWMCYINLIMVKSHIIPWQSYSKLLFRHSRWEDLIILQFTLFH